MIKVRATARGFYGRLRNEDDVFPVKPADAKASWYIALSDLKKVQPNRTPDRPTDAASAKRLSNNELKVFLDAEGIEYADGDVKKDLIIRLFADNENEDEGDEENTDGEDLV